MAKLRKECDELRAAEIRALKAKKEEMKVFSWNEISRYCIYLVGVRLHGYLIRWLVANANA